MPTPEDRLSHLDIYHGNLRENLVAIIREAERDTWNEAVAACAKATASDPDDLGGEVWVLKRAAARIRLLKRSDPS